MCTWNLNLTLTILTILPITFIAIILLKILNQTLSWVAMSTSQRLDWFRVGLLANCLVTDCQQGQCSIYPHTVTITSGCYEYACMTSVIAAILQIFASDKLSVWQVDCIPANRQVWELFSSLDNLSASWLCCKSSGNQARNNWEWVICGNSACGK